MLGGGVIVQRFGDLYKGTALHPGRIEEAFITPTLNATPGRSGHLSFQRDSGWNNRDDLRS